jgi:ABC-2 type transport system permease protein
MKIPPMLAGMLGKELLYIRRNMGLFYSVVAPLVFVMLFAGKLATRGAAAWVFPAAVAYTLLGISPLSYNSFGLEGAGAQFYFLAPVRLRDVLVAKNLMNFGVALLEAAAVYAIVSYTTAPPPVTSAAVAVLWAGGTLLLSCILGNRRSISAPKQINMARAGGKQASPLSALISMGVLLLSVGLAAAIFGAAMWFKAMWVLVPVFALFFAGALWAYLVSLRSVDAFAMEHREALFEELCKKA